MRLLTIDALRQPRPRVNRLARRIFHLEHPLILRSLLTGRELLPFQVVSQHLLRRFGITHDSDHGLKIRNARLTTGDEATFPIDKLIATTRKRPHRARLRLAVLAHRFHDLREFCRIRVTVQRMPLDEFTRDAEDGLDDGVRLIGFVHDFSMA